MVRVLGPVDVVDAEGRQAEFERAKALELVTWLAQHPQSATRAGARAALWAIDVSNASFSNVVSEARRALARLASPPDGADWVARTYAERLPLHPEVVLDADLVRRHLEQARRLPDAEAIVELRQALDAGARCAVRGTQLLWPDAEALPSTLTLLVTTVAAELGRRLLDAGDLDGVFAATAVGLDVLPGHEELIALRLRAHAQRGDRSALHREYMSYEHAVLADPWDGEPSPPWSRCAGSSSNPSPVSDDRLRHDRPPRCAETCQNGAPASHSPGGPHRRRQYGAPATERLPGPVRPAGRAHRSEARCIAERSE